MHNRLEIVKEALAQDTSIYVVKVDGKSVVSAFTENDIQIRALLVKVGLDIAGALVYIPSTSLFIEQLRNFNITRR